MITGLMLKRVQAPTYLVQILAVVFLFGGGSIVLWQLSKTAYSETVVTFLAFFIWQVVTTLGVRFSKVSEHSKSSPEDATKILLGRAVHEVGRMKKTGNFTQVMAWCAGFAVLYVAFRGVLLTVVTVLFGNLWMAGGAGAILGALLIAPWILSDLKENIDDKLAQSNEVDQEVSDDA